MLPRCDCGVWEAEVDQVLGCLAFQTAVHHDAELVLDSLEYAEPMQLSVQQPVKFDVNQFELIFPSLLSGSCLKLKVKVHSHRKKNVTRVVNATSNKIFLVQIFVHTIVLIIP